MKKLLLASLTLTLMACSITLFQMSSCTKTQAQPKIDTVYKTTIDTVYKTTIDTVYKCPNSITGLWEGTYTATDGSSFFFSFSIHPDGTVSYKTKGRYQGNDNYVSFADGTWTLSGTTFSFSVTTINDPYVTTQTTQTGTATYNPNEGTLKNGVVINIHGNSVWSMTKVN